MSTTNPATGIRATHEVRQSACATSTPAIPTYIGLRLTEFTPVITNADARSGWNGSTVVPLRRNWAADAPAIDMEASARHPETAVRPAFGACVLPVSAR